MDELNLVPSEPVWQKVELQIRRKKDRRRLIFWINFLGLLLGGGLWIGVNQSSNKVAYNKNNDVTEKQIKKATENLPITTIIKPADQKSTEHTANITPAIKTQKEKNKEASKKKNAGVVLNNAPNEQDNISKKLKERKPVSVSGEKEIPIKVENNEPDKSHLNEIILQKSNQNNLNKGVANLDTVSRKEVASTTPTEVKKDDHVIELVPDSIEKDTVSLKHEAQNQDTSAIKKTGIKKYATSKWKLNLVAAEGSSDLARLEFFNGQKSFATASYSGGNASTGGYPLYYGPSDIKKGFAFAIGAIAKKQLTKRIFFSTGLRYDYYSNTIQVGNRINQTRVLMDFRVSQYYSNTGSSLQPYKNQYHFVSVPVAIDWQLLKKVPLNFYTSLSMQYLVKTNGLVFDNTSQSYFYSKGAFNSVQLFFEPALTYSVSFKQKLFTFGPQLQYGLTRLEKNNSTYHLTSFGLKAQLQLNKK